MKMSLLALVIGYLFGSIPWALVIGKTVYKTDVREFGSGNLGASNAGRVLGKKVYWAVAILDAIKGLVAFVIVNAISSYPNALLSAIGVIIGHCYPVFAHFKGGKGVASSMGILCIISLYNHNFAWQFALPLISLFVLNKVTDIAAIGSIGALLLATAVSWIVYRNLMTSLTVTIICGFVIYKHKANIIRIIHGEELSRSKK